MSATPLLLALDEQFIQQHPNLVHASKGLAEAYQDKQIIVDDQRLQTIGTALWRALDCEAEFLEKEQASGQAALDIVIESAHPQVLNLAWETLYHPDFGFLGQSPRFTLSRRIPMQPQPRLPAVETTPLRILLFAAMPMDVGEQGRLRIEEEKANIMQAISPLEDQGKVQLLAPDDGRFRYFQQLLRDYQPHLVYLSGHGSLQHQQIENTYQGLFVFEDDNARSLEVPEDDLVECFNNTQVQAIVLSACESGRFDPRELNNGLSIRLAQKGIPHVIGMRESILDSAGLVFTQVFLSRIAAQDSLAVALQAARLAIRQHTEDYVSRDSNPSRIRYSKQQWCLPSLCSHDLQQTLVDWSFTPQPKTYALSFNDSLDSISLPAQFLGRKQEQYQLLPPLLSGQQAQLLLTAAGGMGKTALAGQLCDALKAQGFEVFAYSAREGNQWQDFIQVFPE